MIRKEPYSGEVYHGGKWNSLNCIQVLPVQADEFLTLITCPSCDHDHYWPLNEPGFDHCPYCEKCGTPLGKEKE